MRDFQPRLRPPQDMKRLLAARSRSITQSWVQAKTRILQTGISSLVPRGAVPVSPRHAMRRIDRAP